MKIFVFSLSAALFWVAGCSPMLAHPGNGPHIPVVVVGEDSNKAAVARDSEVFKSVVAEIQEAFTISHYKVLDEDLIALRTKIQIGNSRSKQDVLSAILLANKTPEFRGQIDYGIVFSVIPNIVRQSNGRVIDVRIRGNIYDVKESTAVTQFEFNNVDSIIVPLSDELCNETCLVSTLAKRVRPVARELSEVLIQKLDALYASSGSQISTTEKPGQVVLDRSYRLKIIRFERAAQIAFEDTFSSDTEINNFSRKTAMTSEANYAFDTKADGKDISRKVENALMAAGLNLKIVRIEIADDLIVLQKLAK